MFKRYNCLVDCVVVFALWQTKKVFLNLLTGQGWVGACLCEFLYSMFFCFVVLNTTAARAYSSEGNQFYGLAIGAMALAASYAAGPVSGGLINPAITIGADLAGAGAGFGKSLIYAVFQLLGAAFSALLFKMVRPLDFDENETPRSRLISEMIGTFALVLTVGLAVLAKTPMAVVAIAGCLVAMVYALGDVSGAHFNPAVTVAVLVSGHDPDMIPKRAGYYIGSQLLSAIIAGWCFCLLHNGNSFVVAPGEGFSLAAAAVAEMFFTGLLAFVVLGVAVAPKTKSSQIFGLAIGFCVVVAGFSVGNVSGAFLNPAVSVGVAASGAGWSSVKTAVRYTTFQLLGGSVAGGLNYLLHSEVSEPTSVTLHASATDLIEELTKLVAEFVGTFLLTFTVGCNVLAGNATWGGVSIACLLMVAVYSLGPISGACLNPAVSLALGISKAMGGSGLDWIQVGLYTSVQLGAGIAAAVSYALLYGQSFNLAPAEGFGWLNAGLCEMLYTFMLCFVVLNVAVAKKNLTESNQFFGLAIGLVIIAGAYGAGAVSGGCFNPAVAVGIDVSSVFLGFGWSVLYIVFEIFGAALAVLAFKMVRPEDFHEDKSPKTELVSEFLGTFMLVLTIGLNVLGKSKAGAFSIAAALTAMIYALGDVSGAHFNPAVTVAILQSGRCPELSPAKAGLYIAAQITGGLVAAGTYAFIYVGQSFPLGPVGNSTWGQVVVAELIFTFLLSFVVLSVAVSKQTKSSNMFGFLIGSCVTVGGFAVGGISGGSLNPAVSIGLAGVSILNGGVFLPALAYSAVEIVGGLIAAGVFKVTHEIDTTAEEKEKLVA
ncbi:unnamed protein product [Durusdinium trenchii]|uniref:Uncharacterized protein n=1 Tax=Durusdinium trenchii TaxID=1381693 RepID=A0ABP0SZ80_9DINO